MGHIRMAPLRESKQDIIPLSVRFGEHAGLRREKKLLGITSSVEKVIMVFRWPRNVRELTDPIEWLVLMEDGDRVDINDLSLLDSTGLCKTRLCKVKLLWDVMISICRNRDYIWTSEVSKSLSKLLGNQG